MKYSVDGHEPCSLDELIQINYWDNLNPDGSDGAEWSDEEILAIVKLRVGETWFGGLGADIKRIE